MKQYLVVMLMAGILASCSSTGGVKIVSPSAPENEAKKEIGEAPITRLETASQPPARHEAPERGRAVDGPGFARPSGQTAPSSPSLTSPSKLEALINLLEKKGVISNDELLEEIRGLQKRQGD